VRHGLLLVLAAAACSRAPAQEQGDEQRAQGIRLDPAARGLEAPVHLTAPPGDPRLFIVQQGGRIRVVRGGVLLGTPYLDLSREVSRGMEQGLLSMAFHPRFRENGFFFVNYTDRGGDTRVVRYRADPDADVADPASAHLVLAVDQPYANHNGGHVLFGSDGMLYVGMGDGGSGGDPHGHGQRRNTMLGKLLRIDVDREAPYGIPADNPFARGAGRGERGEIWAYGLRNPWRLAFDSGLLYVADVGQNAWEEVNVVPDTARGLNYGWRIMEGAHCYRNPVCRQDGLVLPAVAYGREDGCSITGGVVYRGRAVPQLVGHYLYSDWCDGWLRSFRWDGRRAVDRRRWDVRNAGSVTSFGVDGQGEVYVLGAGTAWRIVRAN